MCWEVCLLCHLREAPSRRKRSLTHEDSHKSAHENAHESAHKMYTTMPMKVKVLSVILHEGSHESAHESAHSQCSRKCARKGFARGSPGLFSLALFLGHHCLQKAARNSIYMLAKNRSHPYCLKRSHFLEMYISVSGRSASRISFQNLTSQVHVGPLLLWIL